jgi:hypothetical protein
MELILLAVFAGVLWYFFVGLGKLGFWQAVQKYPDEAWYFFKSRPEWFVGHEPDGLPVVGPFRVMNPETGEAVSVYALRDSMEASQREFLQSLRRDA